MPEAWWAGAPSVRAAAWAALLDDDVDVPSAPVLWIPGGFGIARDSSTPRNLDWSNEPKGIHTFAFLPPFDEDETETLRALTEPSPRSGRSAAPSPETIAPIPASPAVSELCLEPRSVPPSPLPKMDPPAQFAPPDSSVLATGQSPARSRPRPRPHH
ncbi:hypothetical protein CspHIS471_0603240 [Cutaneotrichosporon sp. HIS471]|nr:hypothetical protein CspHIS471_0603240 [Cutaneotrichosporon sp. HIS471]